MKRRSLLKLLCLPVAISYKPQAPAGTIAGARCQILQTSPVRGHRYHDGPQVLRHLKIGERLTLIAEPANPFDEFAVRIEWHGKKIGYLPRERNHQVSRMLRGVTREGQQVPKVPVHAIIREIDRDTENHCQPVMVDVLA